MRKAYIQPELEVLTIAAMEEFLTGSTNGSASGFDPDTNPDIDPGDYTKPVDSWK